MDTYSAEKGKNPFSSISYGVGEDPVPEERVSSNRCYSAEDISCILNISMPAVYALLKKKEFTWHRIGNKYRISRVSFDAWLDGK